MVSREPTAPRAFAHRCLAAAWIAVLWLPLLQMTFHLFPEGRATVENRTKAAAPRLKGRSLKALKAFTDAFEKYFNDGFGFRDGLIRSYSLLHLRALRTSPLAGIVIGRDGWLYYDKPDGKNLSDYCGLEPFSAQELDAIERNLTSTSDELRRRGIGFAVVVAPSKHTVYPENLPERIRPLAGATRLDQVADRLSRRPDILFVDARRALLAGKGQRPLYFRTDTHWNTYGAHLASRQLLAALSGAGVPVTSPRDEDLQLTAWVRTQTDMTNMIGLAGEACEQDFRLQKRDGRPSTITVLPLKKGQTPGRETRTCESGEAGPRFVLVQDSFGSALATSLCEEFAGGVAYWDTGLTEEHVAGDRPDVVVFEVVERYLYVLATPDRLKRRD